MVESELGFATLTAGISKEKVQVTAPGILGGIDSTCPPHAERDVSFEPTPSTSHPVNTRRVGAAEIT